MHNVVNPILPGCHPDPSVCRAGEDYWLVVSSFTYWPGLPLFHSRDLVTWEPAGHVIDRPGQLSLAGLETSDGLWAPTIRHHNGVFYVVSTVADERRGRMNFVATATDPRGSWSDPVDLGVSGIDPSLFFDVDGRCWFTGCRDSRTPGAAGPGEIWAQELDLAALTLVGPEHVLWHGAIGGAWVEAPHIVLRDGVYHLIAAEGGTERAHSVTAARARSVTGPWTTDRRSPLLTHRHLSPNHEIQNVGHADLVDTPNGETWALVLGVRPVDDTHVLGRETFLVPVEWSPAGPVLAPETGRVLLQEQAPAGAQPVPTPPATSAVERVTFGTPGLPVGWSGLRGDPTKQHIPGVATDASGLLLAASGESLSGRGTPSLLVRRQQHLDATATMELDFAPTSSHEEAGITVFHAGHRWATLGVSLDKNELRVAVATLESGNGPVRGPSVQIPAGLTRLRVTASREAYELSVLHGKGSTVVARYPREDFSTEVAGGFVGVHLGVYATSAGRPSEAVARVPWFEYRGGEEVIDEDFVAILATSD
jgi:xylan 1,4-beta-xylosidase